MDSPCEKITLNDKSYCVHSKILRQYHVFTTQLDSQNHINIQLTLNNISTKHIIDTLYLQYFGKAASLKFSQFIEILNIFDYFHPNDPKIMYDMMNHYIIEHHVTDDNIIGSQCNDKYKKILLTHNLYKKFADNEITLEYGAGWGMNSEDYLRDIIEFCAKRGVTITEKDIQLDYPESVYGGPDSLHEYKLFIKNINIEIIPVDDLFKSGDIKQSLLKFCRDYVA